MSEIPPVVEPTELLTQIAEQLHDLTCGMFSDQLCSFTKNEDWMSRTRQRWLRRAKNFLEILDGDEKKARRVLQFQASWRG